MPHHRSATTGIEPSHATVELLRTPAVHIELQSGRFRLLLARGERS